MSSTPFKIEGGKPYDLAGTASSGAALPFDTTKLSDGVHTITASIDRSTGGQQSVSAAMTVANGGPQPEPTEPPPTGEIGADQVHLAWVGDTATTLNVVWRTRDPGADSTVQFRPVGTPSWMSAAGAIRPSGTDGALHEVALTGLTPSTGYEYRVAAGGGTWSEVFVTRTGPAGAGDFEVVYLADTGIIGRADGLTTGTAQMIDEVDALDPLAVLLGGDYAYFDSETRYSDLDGAIDAWFNQMQPIGARSPMMVSYGNHEIFLDEGFDPWASRFPTPAGFDGRRFYSFDVGDVHFVSILAASDSQVLSSGAMAWLEQDVLAAYADGARWVIPFFHVSPFADGFVHPANLGLREQLGPLFERLEIDLVLTSHDQSYERTYPLEDVPGSNSPTSTSKVCYTKADGVTYMKVSPAGKLSNKTDDFSRFTTHPAPPWIASRDDTMHHVARLSVHDEGSIAVEVLGFSGDGARPIVVDEFQYTTGSCAPELTFDVGAIELTGGAAGTVSAPVQLDVVGGQATGYSISDDATWLTVDGVDASTPSSVTLRADPTGLTPGIHRATVTASAPGYISDRLEVTFVVSGAQDVLFSSSSDRSGPLRLHDATVSGNIYAFVSPDNNIVRVRFYLDDPSMVGTPFKTEGGKPYDLAGTATTTGAALPFDTTKRSNGLHHVTAAIESTDGTTRVVTVEFTIQNGSP
jgi:hypothetical protein